MPEMWLLVAVVLLVVGAVFLVLMRREGEWQGERRGGARFRLRNFEKITDLRVGVEVPSTLDFEIRRELWFDRWAKAIGLSVEQQLHRDRFDRACYLISDEQRVRTVLQGRPQLVTLLAGLPEGWLASFVFQRMVCRNGELRLDLARANRGAPDARESDALIAQATRRLQALAAELPQELGQAPRRDPVFLRAVLVLGIAGGIAVNGVFQAIRLVYVHMPHMPEPARLYTLATPLAVLILFGLLAATLWTVGRTSRAHLVLIEVLFVGGLGAWFTAYGLVADANMSLDRDPGSLVETRVAYRQAVKRRRYSSYYLHLRTESDYFFLRLPVSRLNYERSSGGDLVRLRDHKGFFGVRWFEHAD